MIIMRRPPTAPRNRRIAWLLLLMSTVAFSQTEAQITAASLVEVDQIKVSGTRIPSESIVALSGIKLRDKMNELSVKAACRKITATGLFKSIDYSYDAYPDRQGVVLNLTVVDEAPLVQASIKPAAEEDAIWRSLAEMDRMFSRQLPPTEKAIAFYSNAIEKCLRAQGRTNEYAAPVVTADSNGNPSAITFEIRTYKSVRSSKS